MMAKAAGAGISKVVNSLHDSDSASKKMGVATTGHTVTQIGKAEVENNKLLKAITGIALMILGSTVLLSSTLAAAATIANPIISAVILSGGVGLAVVIFAKAMASLHDAFEQEAFGKDHPFPLHSKFDKKDPATSAGSAEIEQQTVSPTKEQIAAKIPPNYTATISELRAQADTLKKTTEVMYKGKEYTFPASFLRDIDRDYTICGKVIKGTDQEQLRQIEELGLLHSIEEIGKVFNQGLYTDIESLKMNDNFIEMGCFATGSIEGENSLTVDENGVVSFSARAVRPVKDSTSGTVVAYLEVTRTVSDVMNPDSPVAFEQRLVEAPKVQDQAEESVSEQSFVPEARVKQSIFDSIKEGKQTEGTMSVRVLTTKADDEKRMEFTYKEKKYDFPSQFLVDLNRGYLINRKEIQANDEHTLAQQVSGQMEILEKMGILKDEDTINTIANIYNQALYSNEVCKFSKDYGDQYLAMELEDDRYSYNNLEIAEDGRVSMQLKMIFNIMDKNNMLAGPVGYVEISIEAENLMDPNAKVKFTRRLMENLPDPTQYH